MNNLGGWAICQGVFSWIKNNLPEGSTILEFGSGTGTIELTKHYNVYSIEQDPEWVGLAKKSNYIYAPIKGGWYDPDVLFKNLPNKYDLILVDGPKGSGNRIGLANHWNKLNTNVPIIMDDTDRPKEFSFALETSKTLNKKIYFLSGMGKNFAVLKNASYN
jgi:hypothetical protein